MIKKILVTGVNGFVGKHLVSELEGVGIEVLGIAGKSADQESGKYIQIDLTDRGSVQKNIDFSGIEGVIHLAGLASVGDSFSNPLKYINVNSSIQINLMETALEQGCKPKFIVVSSGSVYDPSMALPLKEESPIKPTSPYSISKLVQEDLGQYYTSRGLECVIARPFNHIGPGQGSGFIVPDLAKQIVEARKNGERSIRVGNLNTKRDYTDVRDIVGAYILLLKKGRSGEVYNICSGTAVSGKEILEGLEKAAKIEINPIIDPSKNRPVDNPVIYGDYSKLNNETGWKPEIKLDQTLADIIASM